MIKINWVGEAFSYGVMRPFVSITAHDVELLFTIQKETELEDEEEFQDRYFALERLSKRDAKTVSKIDDIGEEVESVWFIKTDDEFRRAFKHTYYLLKFYTKNTTLTIGAYSDNKSKPSAENSYLICTTDFINLLAKGVKVEDGVELKDTNFEKMMCIFDKKELAKELLR